jgi:V8-like Glu-specific endopeptidase
MRIYPYFILVGLMLYLPFTSFGQEKKMISHTFRQVENTAEAPFGYIVNLNYNAFCRRDVNATGFFISPRHILTNAHVVRHARNLSVYPGANSFDTNKVVTPFGFESVLKNQIHIPKKFIYIGYVRKLLNRRQWDYALITLPDDSMARRICECPNPEIPFELLPWQQFDKDSTQVVLAGYPISDQAEPRIFKRSQQYDNRMLKKSKLSNRQANTISYWENGKKTFGGSSGSPVWIQTNEAKKKVIALHGYSSAGIVIHGDMYKDLLRWGVPLRPLSDTITQ